MWSYIHKHNDCVELEGFEALGDEFMAFTPIGEARVLLDGVVREESLESTKIRIVTHQGKKYVYDAAFRRIADLYCLYEKPFFLIYGNCYGILESDDTKSSTE